MPSPAGYSRLQIALHWAVALLIAAQFLFNEEMGGAFRALMRGEAPTTGPLVAAHVWGGILIGALVLWRLALRAARGAPPPPEADHPGLRAAATVTHWTLYALLAVIVASGAAAWFGSIRDAGEVDETLTTALLALTGLHVAAALFHQFVLKTDVLVRMRRPGI
jgi:cytochrome b561